MAEIGIIASVIQVAGAGLKLSQTLYQYADSVSGAEALVKNIAKEVRLTSSIIEELGYVFQQGQSAALLSKNAVQTADETIKECSTVFSELDTALKKTKKNALGRFIFPFRETKIELLRSHIDKLKSTLQLLMQVLTHAHMVASQKLDRDSEKAQREHIKALLRNNKASARRYKQSLKHYSNSDGGSEPEIANRSVSVDDSISTASVTASITAITLETCVQHVRDLLDDIELVQQTLSQRSGASDSSDHTQSLIGSYFRARDHLDKILLGNPQSTTISITESLSNRDSPSLRRLWTGTTLHRTETRLSSESAIRGASTYSKAELERLIAEAKEEARGEERARIEQEARCAEFLKGEQEAAIARDHVKVIQEKSPKVTVENETGVPSVISHVRPSVGRAQSEAFLEQMRRRSPKETSKAEAYQADVQPVSYQDLIDKHSYYGAKSSPAVASPNQSETSTSSRSTSPAPALSVSDPLSPSDLHKSLPYSTGGIYGSAKHVSTSTVQHYAQMCSVHPYLDVPSSAAHSPSAVPLSRTPPRNESPGSYRVLPQPPPESWKTVLVEPATRRSSTSTAPSSSAVVVSPQYNPTCSSEERRDAATRYRQPTARTWHDYYIKTHYGHATGLPRTHSRGQTPVVRNDIYRSRPCATGDRGVQRIDDELTQLNREIEEEKRMSRSQERSTYGRGMRASEDKTYTEDSRELERGRSSSKREYEREKEKTRLGRVERGAAEQRVSRYQRDAESIRGKDDCFRSDREERKEWGVRGERGLEERMARATPEREMNLERSKARATGDAQTQTKKKAINLPTTPPSGSSPLEEQAALSGEETPEVGKVHLIRVWEAARATSAAPAYFTPIATESVEEPEDEIEDDDEEVDQLLKEWTTLLY